MIYKALHRNYRLSNTNPTKTGMTPGALEGYTVPALLVAPVVLLLNDTSFTRDMDIVLDNSIRLTCRGICTEC